MEQKESTAHAICCTASGDKPPIGVVCIYTTLGGMNALIVMVAGKLCSNFCIRPHTMQGKH